MTTLVQWATIDQRARPEQPTVDELREQGWTEYGRDPRYPASVLMRREVENE